MENNKIVLPTTYGHFIRLCGTVGDIQCALKCYQEYQKQLPLYYVEIGNKLSIYNQLIYAYVNCNDLKGATDVVDQLIPQNNLEPNDLTYYYLIKYLCEKGEIELAEEYLNKYNKQLSQPTTTTTTSSSSS